MDERVTVPHHSGRRGSVKTDGVIYCKGDGNQPCDLEACVFFFSSQLVLVRGLGRRKIEGMIPTVSQRQAALRSELLTTILDSRSLSLPRPSFAVLVSL